MGPEGNHDTSPLPHLSEVDTEVAQEILTWLSHYITKLSSRDHISTPIQTLLFKSLSNLQTALTSLHQSAVPTTPSPYTFQLKLSIWAYLAFLPFQLYPGLGWGIIPVEFVVSVVYLGFMRVGIKIDSPFVAGKGGINLNELVAQTEKQLEKATGVNIASPFQILNLAPPTLPSGFGMTAEPRNAMELNEKISGSRSGSGSSIPSLPTLPVLQDIPRDLSQQAGDHV
ncbi:hypothetical protein M231_01254 [Tremella mesenterica]|uniref:Uncharacterized protein n=1 Tax=Tremella mesenterica TaxID=5217 RepID=A0A4Q1BTF0_TREME|nr:hypothetical protein M231_01254 [Tremella mesenterica]